MTVMTKIHLFYCYELARNNTILTKHFDDANFTRLYCNHSDAHQQISTGFCSLLRTVILKGKLGMMEFRREIHMLICEIKTSKDKIRPLLIVKSCPRTFFVPNSKLA